MAEERTIFVTNTPDGGCHFSAGGDAGNRDIPCIAVLLEQGITGRVDFYSYADALQEIERAVDDIFTVLACGLDPVTLANIGELENVAAVYPAELDSDQD